MMSSCGFRLKGVTETAIDKGLKVVDLTDAKVIPQRGGTRAPFSLWSVRQ